MDDLSKVNRVSNDAFETITVVNVRGYLQFNTKNIKLRNKVRYNCHMAHSTFYNCLNEIVHKIHFLSLKEHQQTIFTLKIYK